MAFKKKPREEIENNIRIARTRLIKDLLSDPDTSDKHLSILSRLFSKQK